jgi:Tfp pilus assembly protein PilE
MATEQPYSSPGVPAPVQGNGMAVAALVLGILAVVLCWAWFLGGILGILAIIFGALGSGKARRLGGKNKGMAVAGLVLGVVGLVLAIAVIVLAVVFARSVDGYMTKAKTSEAKLQLRQLERRIKSYYDERGELPPSAQRMPAAPEAACATTSGKHPAAPPSAWQEAGWDAIGFSVDEDSYYAYEWIAEQRSGVGARGYAIAIGDLDCDGMLATYRMNVRAVDGSLQIDHLDATPD